MGRKGGFYGPNHEEVGGIWRKRFNEPTRFTEYLGAFGGKRQ